MRNSLTLGIVSLFTLLGSLAFADIVNPLPATSRTGKSIRAIAVQLADGNISTGTSTLWVGKLKNQAATDDFMNFEAEAMKGFKEEFESSVGEPLPATVAVAIRAGKFVGGDDANGDVYKMTTALIRSNAYNDDAELRESQARYLWAALRKLGIDSETMFAHVTAEAMDTMSEELRVIEYFVVAKKSGRAIQFFTIEGTM